MKSIFKTCIYIILICIIIFFSIQYIFILNEGFENNNDVAISISSIEFRPFSAFYVAVQIFEDWTNPPLLQGYSNNVVKGIHAHGMIFPNAAANLMTLTAVALIFTLRLVRKYKGSLSTPAELHTTVLFICLYAWAFNDALRWHARLEHIIDTHDRYAGLSLEKRIRNNAIRCARFPQDCKAELLPNF